MAVNVRIPRRDWGYFFPYLLVGGVFFLVQATGQWRGIGLLIGFVAVPILDALAGPDKENLTQAEEDALGGRLYYRLISLGWVPVQTGLMVFAFYQLHAKGPPVWFAALLAIPFGFMSGGIGITVAHELGHRSNAWDKWGARILLLSVGYAHFLVEHNRGHHIRVATPPDPATARLGESFYRFVVRTVPAQYASAWHLENERCRKKYGRAATVNNHMVWFTLVPVAITAGLFPIGGWAFVAYFVTQAVFAALLLEAVNYVEHYGLLRREISPGVYERVKPQHSWNASWHVSNWLLFKLQRHSDHHAFAARRFYVLRDMADAPQLPSSYPVMILLSLFPPLWRRIMDPRVAAAREQLAAQPL